MNDEFDRTMVPRRRALVAEHIPQRRAAIREALAVGGYDVTEAASSEELVSRLDGSVTHQPTYDVIICSAQLVGLEEPVLTQWLGDARLSPALVLLNAGNRLAAAANALRLKATLVLRYPLSIDLLNVRPLKLATV